MVRGNWRLAPLKDQERRGTFEVLEDRTRSSQYAVNSFANDSR